MKGKPFRDRDNQALHDKRMNESVRVAISRKNIEFILAHQHDSREELARYLRQCKKELGHVPAQSEVIGGDLLALRFGSWATALNHCGYVDYKGPALSALPLERTAIYQEEYERQSKQHVKDKEARKKKAKAEGFLPRLSLFYHRPKEPTSWIKLSVVSMTCCTEYNINLVCYNFLNKISCRSKILTRVKMSWIFSKMLSYCRCHCDTNVRVNIDFTYCH